MFMVVCRLQPFRHGALLILELILFFRKYRTTFAAERFNYYLFPVTTIANNSTGSLGVPYYQAEIKPVEPGPDNAG